MMPSVPDLSSHNKDRPVNFLQRAANALLLLSLSLVSLRATATYRGQIIFKDALAQQLCEQGGE